MENDRLILVVDPGGADLSGWVIARFVGGVVEIVEHGVGQPPADMVPHITEPPGALTQRIATALDKLEVGKADDTIKAPRSGGPPPHTLKNFNRKRSKR